MVRNLAGKKSYKNEIRHLKKKLKNGACETKKKFASCAWQHNGDGIRRKTQWTWRKIIRNYHWKIEKKNNWLVEQYQSLIYT